jgi:hypothetical protein
MDISPNTEAICPIFLKRAGAEYMEQIGSSVVIKIKNRTFLLTVAHIIDFLNLGHLFIPSVDGFAQLHGKYSSFKLPTGRRREEDIIDIAYFILNNKLSKCIHPTIKALERDDLHLTESIVEHDIYTFSGYPISKAKTKGKQYISEVFNFTGFAASKAEYQNLGYDVFFHILVHFNRKNSCTTKGIRQTAPHPKGISGGAVFSWPKDIKTRKKEPEFHLVGIGHTYKEKQHCFIATRINAYLASIFKNNPELLNIPLAQVQQSTSIPMFIGIAWYKQEEWNRLKEEFDDSEKMHKTWNEWRQATESGIEYMARRNKIMYPVLLEADYLKDYCSKNNMPNTSKTRVRIVNEILGSILLEKEL